MQRKGRRLKNLVMNKFAFTKLRVVLFMGLTIVLGLTFHNALTINIFLNNQIIDASEEDSIVPFDLAGKYQSRGPYVYNSVVFKSSGKYRIEHSSCVRDNIETGVLKSREDGAWVTTPKKARSRFRADPPGDSEVFLPVQWGKRRYLIRESRVSSFFEAIENGKEPSFGIYHYTLIKSSRDSAFVFGNPIFPDGFGRSFSELPLVEIIESFKVKSEFSHPLGTDTLKRYIGDIVISNNSTKAKKGSVFFLFNQDEELIGKAEVIGYLSNKLSAKFETHFDVPLNNSAAYSWTQ